jgi:hypothetical protein
LTPSSHAGLPRGYTDAGGGRVRDLTVHPSHRVVHRQLGGAYGQAACRRSLHLFGSWSLAWRWVMAASTRR